ncbi:hypothetical protein [Corynebacterium auriscanis]|uniref:hypothetical protein n=1 Tax=Corynebacterium auriscanis TaxID=99807 RepID=UPI003CF494AC
MAVNPPERLSYLLRWLRQAEESGLKAPLPTKHELANFATRRAEPMSTQPLRIQLWGDALETINVMADTNRFNQGFTAFNQVFFKPNPAIEAQLAEEERRWRLERSKLESDSAAPQSGGKHATGAVSSQSTPEATAGEPRGQRDSTYFGNPGNQGHTGTSEQAGVNTGQPMMSVHTVGPHGAETSGSTRGTVFDFDEDEFTELDDHEDVVPIRGAEVRVRLDEENRLSVSWSIPDEEKAPVNLFRVISFDEPFDYDPAEGEQRVVTDGTHWEDTEALTTASRYFQIWVNQGTSVSEAVRNQPRMLREEVYVKPIEHIDLTFDGRQISGQWEPTPGTERVEVYIADATERKLKRQANLLDTGDSHIQGFRQEPEAEGVEYHVAAVRVIKYESMLTGQISELKSRPSDVKTIFVPAEVETISIGVQPSMVDETSFDVSWSNPLSGEVRIYRTDEPPADGIQDETPELKQLDNFGLPVTGWANNLQRGQESCTVEWPEGWFSLFITPVHVVGEQCKVGQSASYVRVGKIENPALHERVHEQLVTFGWPMEASDVVAYMMPAGSGHTFDVRNKPIAEASIDRNTYEDYGGLRLKMTAPADLVLVPSRVYGGKQVEGDPTVIFYRGIEKFTYRIERDHNLNLYLQVASLDRVVNGDLDFTLVYHPNRLPLEPKDGQEVEMQKLQWGQVQSAPTLACYYTRLDPVNGDGIAWMIDPRCAHSGQGFLRLFFRDPQPTNEPMKALIDPPVEQLSLTGGRG